MMNFIQNALGAKKLSLFVLGLLMSIAGIQRANAANEIYATLSGSTMTLYYDDQKASRSGVLDKWSPVQGTDYVPEETRNSITKAVIDPSMVDARPTGTYSWFESLANLTTIEGLANLNTSEVTDMSYMFYECKSLTSLDLTGFNTAKVQNIRYIFYSCSSLTSLDVSNFNTAKMSDMRSMFGLCTSLTTIYCEDDWSTGSASSGYMFYGCTSLEGGNGTAYNSGKIDKTYARPDGLDDKPGYFTAKGTVKKEIYAALSGSTMTLYYDDQKASHSDVLDKWSPGQGMSYVPEETHNSITKVVINPSMKDARPTSTRYWFRNLPNLTTIEGLANLNTSEVTNMSYMFYDCESLTSLDVSKFNTAKVTDMSYMFAHCYALTSLDVSNFNTANVSKMEGMFYGCTSLTSLDVSNFNTAKVQNMNNMFAHCYALTTIYCDEDWSTGSATSVEMFYGCTSLEGGKGTAYNSDKNDKTYARPDGMGGKPGYFTAKGVVKTTIYATLSGFTMTLYYDDQKDSRSGVLDKWSAADGTYYLPEETRNSITKVVINPSMEDARPASTRSWFLGLANLTTIEGLANFNTSEVTDMYSMFSGCKSLTSLDLTGFNTAKVQNMNYMFTYCYALTSLDVSNFNTDNVSGMEGMFYVCKSLTSLDLTGFNTANVTTMYGMFNGCSSLTTINCEDDWSTGSATSDGMFYGCTSLEGGNGTAYNSGKTDKTYARLDGLDGKPGYFSAKGVVSKTIYATLSGATMTLYYDDQKASRSGVLADWSPAEGTSYVPEETRNSITKVVINPSMEDARPTSTYRWFRRLANLTTIDGLANLNTSEVTKVSYMFEGCSSLTSLDVSSFNTAKVTEMNGMFYGCESLISLDVSNFNTESVTNMSYMFYYCSSLTTINCEDDWSTGSATSDGMFYGCTSLEGGNGTKYDAGKTDATYARLDGLDGKPGYFSAKGVVRKTIYATLSGSTMTLYYDDQKASRSGVLNKWSPGQGTSYVPEKTCNSITKAVIDPSMVDARPTSTYRWFRSLANLTTIEGLANLNTSEVTDMSYMFNECKSLTSLDLTGFNTAKVQNIRYIFYSCSSLTSLDVSNFNTAKMSDMRGMFQLCSSLTTINCEDDWSTGSATSDGMFYGCTSLEGGNGTKYDAGKTDATYARLDGLDGKPGYFSAKGVVRKTIYAALSGSTMTLYYDDQKASRSGVLDKWSPGQGTSYVPEEARNSITKAVIDPSMEDARPASTDSWFWRLANLTIIEGLANLNTSEVTDMSHMFRECKKLTSLDLSNFNIPKVTKMEYMFYYCSSLISLDLSNFNTSNVTKMEYMFYGCTSLTSLDLSNFNTSNVTSTVAMFYGCTSLTTIYCDEDWSTGSATSDNMFYGCTSLEGGKGTKYDADKIDATYARPDGMGGKPGYFKELGPKEIYAALNGSTMTIYFDNKKTIRPGVLDKWTPGMGVDMDDATCYSITKAVIAPSIAAALPTKTNFWFWNLANLTAIDGLAYLNTSEVTNMSGMFMYCALLTEVDVSTFNTGKVTNMRSMFSSCPSLTELDLTGFNTGKVNDMETMFYGCSSLQTIYCDETWTPSVSNDMFKNCTSLVGGYGTKYDADKTDAIYARPDGLGGQLGYFTASLTPEEKKEIDAVIDLINGIGTVTYTPECKAQIDAARAAYDALTDVQKAFISPQTLSTLIAAEQTYAELKQKAEADLAAAGIVMAKIDAIGTVAYTEASKALIDAARTAYDALTAAQKVLVTNYGVLTAAEKAYADLKAKAEADQAAANAVIVKIDAIGTVTLSSEAAILDARSAYDALTADQKALVTNLPTLVAAEAALDQLKKQAAADQAAANIVISKISAVGTVEYTTECKARIDAAREAYDGLTAAQKVLVTNYGVLTAAEKAYADLKAKAEADQAAANAVIVKIDAIGDVTLASEPAIVAARSAYDALTAAQKLLVTNLSTLTAAEAKLEILKKQAESDEAAAKAVTDLINAIGTVTYTSESKARIDAAREAYDALTDAQKGLVSSATYKILTDAEQAYADLKAKAEADQAAANAVIAKIDAIGTVTLESEAAITAARTAYDALTAAQQALVTNFGTLLSAEATLELLKHQAETDKAAADAVIAKINAIGTVTLESEAAILDARSAYDALTAAQKALVTNLSTLTAAEKKLAELKANAEAVENAKLQLKNIVSQANELKAVALIYAPSAVSDLDAVINDAQSMIDDPNATVDQINAEAATLTGDLHTIAVNLLDQAKEQLKQSIIALFLPGDYPSWYASVITPALNQVDGMAWDFNKTVNENIVFFQTTGTQIYNDTKSALEALRAGDTRTIVTACAFTGFENAVRTDMTWDISALNDLINTLNTSVASEPYRLDAEMSSLGKWDPVNEELVILDPAEAQKLTAGDYRFISAVWIDGEEANLYRLPKATEEVLSVTVDGAVWTIDLSGIVIDVAYCYTVVKSPMFTVSKGEDVELVNEDRIKTQKIYHNGHFYILRGEHIFDIRGTMVK